MRTSASPTFHVGACLKQPDSSIGPRGHESERLPSKATTVVEIVYLHWSRESLKGSLGTWISPESYVRSAVGADTSRNLIGSKNHQSPGGLGPRPGGLGPRREPGRARPAQPRWVLQPGRQPGLARQPWWAEVERQAELMRWSR